MLAGASIYNMYTGETKSAVVFQLVYAFSALLWYARKRWGRETVQGQLVLSFVLKCERQSPCCQHTIGSHILARLLQRKTFVVAGPKFGADRAVARLRDACDEVAQSSTTLDMHLLSWQAPLLL